jgi:hypothetical protein
MPRESTWITAREEVCSEGTGDVPDFQILGTNTLDDQLASEEVIWTFLLGVGVHIGLLGVTVESISSGERGTRHWAGEQGAAAATARNRLPRIYSCTCCRHTETRSEYWLAGLRPIEVNRFKYGLLDMPSYRAISSMNRELRFADGAGTTTKRVPTYDGGHIQRYTEMSLRFSKAMEETLPPPRSIAINLEPRYNVTFGRIYNFS